jgi:hypothetical protein
MKGAPVYIMYTGTLRDLILATYTGFSRFIGNNGILYCRLKKALSMGAYMPLSCGMES